MSSVIAYLYWDPNREIFHFNIPFIGRPILWYGFFFACAFFLAYWITFFLMKEYLEDHKKTLSPLAPKEAARIIIDKTVMYVVFGTLIGARLGDILFYQDLREYIHHPFGIFKVWEGGLASHGGVIGVMLGIFLCAKKLKKKFSFLNGIRLLDFLAIPASLVGCLIRIGNFFNQEILGKPTNLPWAIIFGHPADGRPAVPRHPAQLYESLFYLFLFLFLFLIWKKTAIIKREGRLTGLFFILFFTFRFFIEFCKVEQSVYEGEGSLLMGQLLSIPFILLGFYLFFKRDSSNRR